MFKRFNAGLYRGISIVSVAVTAIAVIVRGLAGWCGLCF
jgi:hypothetical protein